MLSLEECKKIIQPHGISYSDVELKKIRYWLYKLGELDYQLYKVQKNNNHANCNYLHPGFNRGTK
jgi:hypothetical protein